MSILLVFFIDLRWRWGHGGVWIVLMDGEGVSSFIHYA